MIKLRISEKELSKLCLNNDLFIEDNKIIDYRGNLIATLVFDDYKSSNFLENLITLVIMFGLMFFACFILQFIL